MRYAGLIFSLGILLAGTFDRLVDENTDIAIKMCILIVLGVGFTALAVTYIINNEE